MLVEVRTTDERLAADGAQKFVRGPSLAHMRRLRVDVFKHFAAAGTLQVGMGSAAMTQQRITAFERRRTILALKPAGLVVGTDVTAQIR